MENVGVQHGAGSGNLGGNVSHQGHRNDAGGEPRPCPCDSCRHGGSDRGNGAGNDAQGYARRTPYAGGCQRQPDRRDVRANDGTRQGV